MLALGLHNNYGVEAFSENPRSKNLLPKVFDSWLGLLPSSSLPYVPRDLACMPSKEVLLGAASEGQSPSVLVPFLLLCNRANTMAKAMHRRVSLGFMITEVEPIMAGCVDSRRQTRHKGHKIGSSHLQTQVPRESGPEMAQTFQSRSLSCTSSSKVTPHNPPQRALPAGERIVEGPRVWETFKRSHPSTVFTSKFY